MLTICKLISSYQFLKKLVRKARRAIHGSSGSSDVTNILRLFQSCIRYITKWKYIDKTCLVFKSSCPPFVNLCDFDWAVHTVVTSQIGWLEVKWSFKFSLPSFRVSLARQQPRSSNSPYVTMKSNGFMSSHLH